MKRVREKAMFAKKKINVNFSSSDILGKTSNDTNLKVGLTFKNEEEYKKWLNKVKPKNKNNDESISEKLARESLALQVK